jgi:MoaA/NifB/PqqE/SkfB family radical SAM enzyme
LNMTRVLYRKLRLKLGKPVWVDYPENIQFDTQNQCNLSCQYCNVKIGGCYNLPRGKIPLEIYETVLRHFGKKRGMWSISQFMNGEPTLDERLPKLVSLAMKHTGTPSLIDTNGTVTANRHLLLHPNLRLVRFTISAATRDTYRIVHGKDLFDDAVKNFKWFNEHKYPSQRAWLHFITTEDNKHEVDKWIQLFRGYGRTIFPVHVSPMQKNSIEVKHKEWQPRPFAVYPDGSTHTVKPEPTSPYYPCPCWSILAIGFNGEIMQCCDYPYKYNYGKVGEVDLDEAWKERNKVGFDNECCKDCSLKFSHGTKIFQKYVN